MTGRILDLLALNLLMLALGTGLLPLLRLAGSRRELLERAPLAYLVGIVATGVAAAELAVVDMPVGWLALALLAAAALVLGLRRVGATAATPRRPLDSGVLAPSLALLAVAT